MKQSPKTKRQLKQRLKELDEDKWVLRRKMDQIIRQLEAKEDEEKKVYDELYDGQR